MSRSTGKSIESGVKHGSSVAQYSPREYARNAKDYVKSHRGRRPTPEVTRTAKRLKFLSRRGVI